MSTFYLITSVPFLFWIIRNTLFWVNLWQLKEYRFDRVLIHLRETEQGKNLLFSKLSLIKWLVVFLYIFIIVNNKILLPYQYIVGFLYVLQTVIVLREIYSHLLKRPVFTFKASFIVFITLLIIFSLFLIPFTEGLFWLLFLDRLTVLIISILVFFLSFPTEIYRDFKIEKSVKKLNKNKNVLVIGLTGSYGKSSTKDYLAQILSIKFKVVKTQGTNNTPIGIANTILSDLKKDTEIFIVEMGAYKRGEISQMCKIVSPKIGILTAVSNQHLSLFKTIENVMETKYELIQSLPKDGLAIFNGNNENTLKLYNKTKKRKAIYKTYDSAFSKKDDFEIAAFNILVEKQSLTFDVFLKGKIISNLKAPLIGKHNIEDILPGIYLANDLGIKEEEIREAVSFLKPLKKTMAFYQKNSIAIIDDTFNASPDAVLAALEYMKIFKKKKFLVLQPMIELGDNAHNEHYRIAAKASNLCDYLLLTNKNFYKDIERGIVVDNTKCQIEVGNSSKLSNFIINNIEKGDIIIFEGKESAFVFDKFYKILLYKNNQL